MKEQNDFKPYIPAEKVTPEFTVTSIVLGIILAVVFGAANAYLGLRVGMTISASIPAAVISMGVIRVMMKKNSYWKATSFRRWVLRENLWLQELSLHCQLFFYGLQKEKWKRLAFWKLH